MQGRTNANMRAEGDYLWSKYTISPIRTNGNFITTALPDDMTNPSIIEYNGNLHMFGDGKHYKETNGVWLLSTALPLDMTGKCKSIIYNGKVHIFSDTHHVEMDSLDAITELDNLDYPLIGDVCQWNGKIHLIGVNSTIASNNLGAHYTWSAIDGYMIASELPEDVNCTDGVAVEYNNSLYFIKGNSRYVMDNFTLRWSLDGTFDKVIADTYVNIQDVYYFISYDNDTNHVVVYTTSDLKTFTEETYSNIITNSSNIYNTDYNYLYRNNRLYLCGKGFAYLVYIMDYSHTFKSYVVSKNDDKYPDDGIAGNFYYKKATTVT